MRREETKEKVVEIWLQPYDWDRIALSGLPESGLDPYSLLAFDEEFIDEVIREEFPDLYAFLKHLEKLEDKRTMRKLKFAIFDTILKAYAKGYTRGWADGADEVKQEYKEYYDD